MAEPSMLVDPTVDDPSEHIGYLKLAGRWRIAGLTDRGSWTISVLELDRDSFVNEANKWAADVVEPEVERLRQALATGDRTQYERSSELLAKWASPDGRWSQFSDAVINSELSSRLGLSA